MRAFISALVVMAAVSANAQTSTTTTTEAAGTTTTSTTEVKPAATKKFKGAFASQWNLDAGTYASQGGDAAITTANTLSGSYIADAETTFTMALNFEANSIPLKEERATSDAERAGGKFPQGFAPLDPYLAMTKNHGSMLGSEPVSVQYRVYLPVYDMNRQGINANNNRKGSFRVVGEVPWTLSPKWTVSYSIDPRIKFRERGSSLSWRHYGNVYYNVSDKIQPYAMAGIQSEYGRPGVRKPAVIDEETGEMQDADTTSAETFLTGRRTGASNEDQGYAEYGVTFLPMPGVALIVSYSTTWNAGSGATDADKPFLYDTSSYGFIGSYSF